MKRTIYKLFAFALSFLFVLSACQKDEDPQLSKEIDSKKQSALLAGTWVETPGTSTYNRAVTFLADGSIVWTVVSKSSNYFFRAKSNYEIKADSLIFQKTFVAETDDLGNFINKPSSFVLFPKATYRLDGSSTLLLDYISYPADAPTRTRMTLVKYTAPKNPVATLDGTWIEIPAISQTTRSITFNAAKEIVWTVASQNSKYLYQANSRYETKNDSLKLQNTVFKETNEQGQAVHTLPYALFPDATYRFITPSKMLLNYTSFPADAPVFSTMILAKKP